MKIFYTSAFRGNPQYKDYVNQAHEVISRFKDVELISTEDKSYLHEHPELKSTSNLKHETESHRFIHYNSIKRGIFEADAVIIDATSSSFRLGHEATMSAQQGKPTLVLSQHKDYSNLIDYPNFFGAQYRRLTLEEIIQKFLKHAQRTVLKHRFNMFISENQKEFIEMQASKQGANRSQYLRSLVEADMDKQT